jgi:hypothetical protein
MSERKHLRRFMTIQSKANITLMLGDRKVLRSDLRKMQNYTIETSRVCLWITIAVNFQALTCMKLFDYV